MTFFINTLSFTNYDNLKFLKMYSFVTTIHRKQEVTYTQLLNFPILIRFNSHFCRFKNHYKYDDSIIYICNMKF